MVFTEAMTHSTSKETVFARCGAEIDRLLCKDWPAALFSFLDLRQPFRWRHATW